jgi:hypothetical protein
MRNNVLVSFGEQVYTERTGVETYCIHFNRVAFTFETDEIMQVNDLFRKTFSALEEGDTPAEAVVAWNGIAEVRHSTQGFFMLRIFNCTLCLCERMLRCFSELCACVPLRQPISDGIKRDAADTAESDIDTILTSITKEVFGDE